MIDAGADVNEMDFTGLTPLHWVALQGNAEVIPVLVKAGADIPATDHDGDTPLDKARRKKQWGVGQIP